MNMNILITGGNGYLAKSINHYLKHKYNITTITRQDFDLCDPDATSEWFRGRYFDVVLHTAIVGGNRLHKDDDIIIHKNTEMFNNLLFNKSRFNKLISFGSGAEIFQYGTPYGISKNRIASIIRKTENLYNLRIFAAFDENELSTRFIKANILRYINKEPMIIHSDKVMDFIYMSDFIEIVKYYIETPNPAKTTNCSYSTKYTLTNIVNYINSIDNYKVPVIIESPQELDFYCGNPHGLNIDEIGLKIGIYATHTKLKYA